MKAFLMDYIQKHSGDWAVTPELIHGDEFQDCLLVKFGEPKVAAYAHMDSVGFTTRYENQLVPIGSPEVESGFVLTGSDSQGSIECKLIVDKDNRLFHDFGRAIDRGTELVFKPTFKETGRYIESCYLDNRLGVYTLLRLAETLENGLLVFSCWEEQGGGSVPYLARYMFEQWQIRTALVADITWVTDGVQHGKGVAISMRDKNIPRRSFIDQIINLANTSGIEYQLEVEAFGSSDGRELQYSPYPIDWCFIGAPESGVHSPHEKVHKADIAAMVSLYKYLMPALHSSL